MLNRPCQSCEPSRINGVFCHEQGCPDAWRTELRECKECGSEFRPEHRHQRLCCHGCDVFYSGLSCHCSECIDFAPVS